MEENESAQPQGHYDFPEHAMLPNKCVSNIITPQYSYGSLLVLILPVAYLLSPSPLYCQGGREAHRAQNGRALKPSLCRAAARVLRSLQGRAGSGPNPHSARRVSAQLALPSTSLPHNCRSCPITGPFSFLFPKIVWPPSMSDRRTQDSTGDSQCSCRTLTKSLP